MVTQARKGRATTCSNLAATLTPRLFKALGDPTRLHILASLASQRAPQAVSEIATCCPIDLSVVSRHLGLLRDAGIVTAEKRGRQVYYQVRYGELAATLRRLADAIEACCPPA